jgi:hypothetical protein
MGTPKRDDRRRRQNDEERDVEENNIENRQKNDVDPYTGETLPPETEGDIPLDDIQVEPFASESEILPLDEDAAMDFLLIDSDADIDPIMDEMDGHTSDEDVLEEFSERQALTGGSGDLLQDLLEHNAQGPQLSGGDIDAAWDSSIVSGEESVGGTVSTPDQDVVDELGEAVGITYDDDEELNTEEKLGKRDRERWEMDPRSADEVEEENQTNKPSREQNEDLDDF